MQYQKITRSDTTFTALILLMVLGKMIWLLLGVDHPIVQQPTNSWSVYLLAAVLGFLAIKLARLAGFTDIWDDNVTNRQRLLIPFLAGLGFGVVNIIIAKVMKLNVPMVEFPYSIPVYFSVGILMEILLHLIPIVLLVWLISNVILRKRWENKVFWTVAILFSLIEPIGQTIGMQQMGIITSSLFAGILFVFIFAANLLPLYLFRIYGFLSAVVWRLSFYLIWHII